MRDVSSPKSLHLQSYLGWSDATDSLYHITLSLSLPNRLFYSSITSILQKKKVEKNVKIINGFTFTQEKIKFANFQICFF